MNERSDKCRLGKLVDLYLVVAGASDFPHSRQDDLDRDVINPQNGHILAVAKRRRDGLSDDSNIETKALAPASRTRSRARARSRVSFINVPPTP